MEVYSASHRMSNIEHHIRSVNKMVAPRRYLSYVYRDFKVTDDASCACTSWTLIILNGAWYMTHIDIYNLPVNSCSHSIELVSSSRPQFSFLTSSVETEDETAFSTMLRPSASSLEAHLKQERFKDDARSVPMHDRNTPTRGKIGGFAGPKPSILVEPVNHVEENLIFTYPVDPYGPRLYVFLVLCHTFSLHSRMTVCNGTLVCT